jgi:hypothetical protein
MKQGKTPFIEALLVVLLTAYITSASIGNSGEHKALATGLVFLSLTLSLAVVGYKKGTILSTPYHKHHNIITSVLIALSLIFLPFISRATTDDDKEIKKINTGVTLAILGLAFIPAIALGLFRFYYFKPPEIGDHLNMRGI